MVFIGNVYTPQKSAQEAMADSTQQSVNAVKMGIDETVTWVVRGDEVIATVKQYCNPTNRTNIVVEKEGGTDCTFLTSTKFNDQEVDVLINLNGYYEKTYRSGEIRFVEI